MSTAPTLLESVQGALERTYGLRRTVHGAGRFVIGDAGLRALYSGVEPAVRSASEAARGARTLVRETPDGLRACIYYPDALIATLEAHPPQAGLREENVDAFAVLVEELDHLLVVADHAESGRPVSLFELELHANVSKHLVLSRFAAGRHGRLDGDRRAWLRWHLFHKPEWSDDDPSVRQRYRDATRWSLRFVDKLDTLRPGGRLEALRTFHAATVGAKLRLIERCGGRP